MRAIFSAFVQFVLFLVTFFLGSFVLHPFHLQTTLASDDTHTRVFLWDGLLLMAILYLLALALAAVLKRLRTTALPTTIAVALAAVLGLMAKFGFVITDR